MPPSETPSRGPVCSRRQSLARGAAATLAAARACAPAGLFVGCSLGIPPRAPVVRVGLLHSQTGTMAIGSTSLRDIELHAFERINAEGGILGHRVEAAAPDPRSSPALFAKRAERLLAAGAVALFGCWTSVSRKAVLPIVERARKLLFYPVAYEGNESSPFVVYGGGMPNQLVLPALDWLAAPAGGAKQRIFLLGSDYVFPRTANYVAKKHLATLGVRPVGELYLPLGHRDFSAAVQQILFAKADCVLNTVNGDSNVGLFAALAAARVDPEKLPVVSTSISEDDLRSLPRDHALGHYAASPYFQSLDGEANRRWIEEFRREFGRDRTTGDPMESAWCLVHLWKAAVERAGSFETEAVRQVFREHLEFAGPGGTVRLDPKTQHCTRRFHVGRIRADRQFDVVHSSAGPIDPDPYPQSAFPGWKVDWLDGGLTRGPEVEIDGDV